MGAGAAGGIVLSAHRDIVGHPATLAAVSVITLAFFTWVFLRKRGVPG
jgi:hypothetical protein